MEKKFSAAVISYIVVIMFMCGFMQSILVLFSDQDSYSNYLDDQGDMRLDALNGAKRK
jgi:hypothetical protein